MWSWLEQTVAQNVTHTYDPQLKHVLVIKKRSPTTLRSPRNRHGTGIQFHLQVTKSWIGVSSDNINNRYTVCLIVIFDCSNSDILRKRIIELSIAEITHYKSEIRSSIKYWPLTGHHWPLTDHQLTSYWSSMDHPLTHWSPKECSIPTNHSLSSTEPPLTTHWPPIDHLLIVHGPLTNSLITKGILTDPPLADETMTTCL